MHDSLTGRGGTRLDVAQQKRRERNLHQPAVVQAPTAAPQPQADVPAADVEGYTQVKTKSTKQKEHTEQNVRATTSNPFTTLMDKDDQEADMEILTIPIATCPSTQEDMEMEAEDEANASGQILENQ
ncbi:unnamed protein product [Calypogeia fissa]